MSKRPWNKQSVKAKRRHQKAQRRKRYPGGGFDDRSYLRSLGITVPEVLRLELLPEKWNVLHYVILRAVQITGKGRCPPDEWKAAKLAAHHEWRLAMHRLNIKRDMHVAETWDAIWNDEGRLAPPFEAKNTRG